MESDNDSFVEVMETDCMETTVLSAQATPRHNAIGNKSKLSTTQICATIKACELPEDEATRAPVDIVVALDVSGSMSGNKLALCKDTLNLLLRELRPTDNFGLVTFASDCRIESPARKMTNERKKLVGEQIAGLRTRGCTNISGAIGMAAQEIKAIEHPNSVRTIFLLTDGHANEGVCDHHKMVELTKGCLSVQDDGTAPISMHCFGYGTDHDANLLGELSQATEGGTYYFVEDDKNVKAAFGDALGGILSVVAQNAAIEIRVPPAAQECGVSLLDVYHDKKIKQNDGSFVVNLGDFYAEESRDVLFELSLAAGASVTKPVPHASITLSFLDTLGNKLAKLPPIEVSIARPDTDEVSPPNTHVHVQMARIDTIAAMASAETRARGGDLAGARAKINAQIALLEKAKAAIDEKEEMEVATLVQLNVDMNGLLSGLESARIYSSRGSKMMRGTVQMHSYQRCAEARTEGSYGCANVYEGARKKTMKMKFTAKR